MDSGEKCESEKTNNYLVTIIQNLINNSELDLSSFNK